MKALYINGIGSINALGASPNEAETLVCVEPDYKQYLDSTAVRRLSKLIKRTLVAAKMSLQEAHIQLPDAIVTGTGLGCLEDTEKFLSSVLEDELGMLSPTAFIQSTHNTLSGQIALMLKCHGYNTTYAQRSLSFEQAVEDSMMWLQDTPMQHVLVGGADEISLHAHRILQKIGLFRSPYKKNSLPIAGEGAHYFVLSSQKNEHSKAKVLGLQYMYQEIQIKKALHAFLEEHQLTSSEIDAVILGNNGHPIYDNLYIELASYLPESWHVTYKHLTGEYFTASAFAWKLACDGLASSSFEDRFVLKKSARPLNTLLIYNHFQNKEHSFALLKHVES